MRKKHEKRQLEIAMQEERAKKEVNEMLKKRRRDLKKKEVRKFGKEEVKKFLLQYLLYRLKWFSLQC